MSTPPVDFCFLPRGSIREMARIAMLGEQLGYRCMWIPDQGFGHDPFVLASTVIAATRTLEVGIGITSPLTRHPMHIARVAASLAEASDGRLRLGLGAGNKAHVIGPMGLSAANAVDRVRLGVTQVRALLNGEAVMFDDESKSRTVLENQPKVCPPIYIGGRGPKMLQMAGEVADGVLVESLFSGDGMPNVLENVSRGTGLASRDISDCDVTSWQVVVPTVDRHDVINRHRSWIARAIQAGPRESMLRVGVDAGIIDEVCGAMAAGRTDDAIAAVSDDAVEKLIMLGDADHLIHRISNLAGQGCTSVSILCIGDFIETTRTLTDFSEKVLPGLA